MPLESKQIETLKGYMQHGELVFIGPYSDANRPITKIEGDWAYLNNSNKINLLQCETDDFGILTRVAL